jgi:hypothetical protein
VVVPFENRLVATVALVLSAFGLRASLLDFFCPLAILVSLKARFDPIGSKLRDNLLIERQKITGQCFNELSNRSKVETRTVAQ